MSENSANIDKIPLCSICQHPVSEKENSVKCSGLCGKCQHISCLIFRYDDDGNDIIWKCNDCLIKVEYDHVAAGSEELQEPVGNCNLVLEENIQSLDYETKNFPIKSSLQLGYNAFDNCSAGKTDSEKISSTKDISYENTTLNEMYIKREMTDQSYPSPKKQKLADNIIMQPSKELITHNDDYIILENMTKLKNPKLFDHLGYTYTIRKNRLKKMEWQCSRRRVKKPCKSIIIQSDNCFTMSKYKHNHPGDLKLYAFAKEKKEQNLLLHKTTLFNEDNLEDNLPTGKVGRIPGEKEISLQEVTNLSEENKSEPLKSIFNNYKCSNKAEGSASVKCMQLHKLDKLEKQKENLKKGVKSKNLSKTPQIKQKSVYILLDDGNDLSSKLFDQTLGYTYNLYRVTEKGKIFLCTKSNTAHKCEAAVKQVGNYFIRSGKKHNHKNRKCPSLDQEQNNRNDVTDIVRLESEETSTSNAPRTCQLRKSKVSVKICEPQLSVVNISEMRLSEDVRVPSENDIDKILLEENDVDKIFLNILDSLHYAGVYLTNNVVIENIRNYVNENGLDVNVDRPWVAQFFKKYEKQIGDRFIQKSSYKDLLSLLPGRVKSLFDDLERLLSFHDLNIEEMLSKDNSNRIFNCDIMKVTVNDRSSNIKSRETFSIQCCVNASGKSTKPVIINKGRKILTYKMSKEFEGDYNCICSSTGEFTDDMFLTWLSEDFIYFLIENNIKTPVLLLVNGTRIPISWNCLDFANKNGIILFRLPLFEKSCQPLACGILKAVRRKYRVLEQNFKCNSTELYKVFPTLYMKALMNVDIKRRCHECFEATGICPLDIKKLTSTFTQKASLSLSKCRRTSIDDDSLSITSDESDVQERLFNSYDDKDSSSDKSKANNDDSELSTSILQTDLHPHKNSPEKLSDFKSKIKFDPNESLANVRKLGIDKISLKLGYKLALNDMEKIYNSILEPATLEMFQRKLEDEEELCDTNFAVWQGLQQLKEVPELFEKMFEDE